MPVNKSISVIIPNYNGRHLLEEFLPFTFAATENAGVEYEIIVIDDASKDDSIAFIQSVYSQIKLIVNTENKGFSYSCNRGIESSTCDLVLLLNSDVKLHPDYFEHQFNYFDEADTFGVMGRIIDMEGDKIQDSARIARFNGLKIKTDFYYTLNPSDKNYSFYLSGANALIDANKLKELGGFNELFSPFYGEDLELSLRAWRLGWKCYYEHQSVCRHKASASTKNYKTPKWVKSIYYRNRFYVHAIHLNNLYVLVWFLQITVIDFIPKLLFGNFWIWKSYTGLLKSLPEIRKSRYQIKKMMVKRGSRMSIFDLAKLIKQSIQKKDILCP
ncbi:MAG: glycosyltransferase family 2 protein [Pyrinomonadaceae bacterium]|nr:glycosyltransferase family 2 protein [Sphingobacteriaceae bacterium]